MRGLRWLWVACLCLGFVTGCEAQAPPPPAPSTAAVPADVQKADALLADAQQALKTRDYKKALDGSTQAFELYQKNPQSPPGKVNEAREAMGSSALALGDWEKAAVAFGALALLDPGNKTARDGLATAQAALDKQRAAETAARAARERQESEARRRQAAASRKATAETMRKAGVKASETRAVAYRASGSGPAVQYKTVGGRSMYLYTDPKTGLPVQSETPPTWYRPGCNTYVILCDKYGRKLDIDPIPQNDYTVWEARTRRSEQQARNQAQIEALTGRSPSGPGYPGGYPGATSPQGYRPGGYPGATSPQATRPAGMGASYPQGSRPGGYPGSGYRGPSIPSGPSIPGPSYPGRR